MLVPRIHLLSDAVAGQIAAGEVIHRPASVVKELLENSIDASADVVTVDIEDSGLSLLRVSDNGQGIHPKDLKLALTTHATSKLSRFSDLDQITSLGFRGEALASIAAVSKLNLISRTVGSDHAYSIDNNLEIKPAAHPIGTTVEVRDLFFSVPARRKFLKSAKTELLHIKGVIKAISLSQPAMSFVVRRNQQMMMYDQSVDTLESRIASVLGNDFLSHSIMIDKTANGMRLFGRISQPSYSRSETTRQYFYVNGRIIEDRYIRHAIQSAYAHHLESVRYPVYVLYLELDPETIDINVHPAKSVVQFSGVTKIHDFIYTEVSFHLSDHQELTFTDVATELHDQSKVIWSHEYETPDNRKVLSQNDSGLHYFLIPSMDYVITTQQQDCYLIALKQTRLLLSANYLLRDYLEGAIEVEKITVPIVIVLSDQPVTLSADEFSAFASWGVLLEEFGNGILLRSVPRMLRCADSLALFADLYDSLTKQEDAEKIANRLSLHIYDADDGRLSDSIVENLLSGIHDFEDMGDHDPLPWRRICQEDFKTFLTG